MTCRHSSSTHLPRPSLLALLVLSLLVREGRSTLYSTRTVEHAQTPITTYSYTSSTLCAIRCFSEPDCTKFSHSDGLCQLWPLHSADNPLTSASGELFQPPLPRDFVLSDDPTIAYKQVSERIAGDRVTLTAACRTHDPDALPAVPDTLAKLTYLKSVLASSYSSTGVWQPEGGVIKNMNTDELLELSSDMFGHKTGSSNVCYTVYSSGFYAQDCDSSRAAYICQYTV